MGFFSTERKVHVSTNTVRVVEDNMIPNSVLTGAVKSIFEEGDMTDYILEELVHNISIKANKTYKYAKNNSPLGVPSQVFIERESGNEEVLAILKNLYGDGGIVHYSYFGVPNYYHFGWEALVAQGYDSRTNMLNGFYLDYFALEFGLDTFDDYSEDVYATASLSPYSGYKPWSSTDTFAETYYPPIDKVAGLAKPRLLVVTGKQESLPEPNVTYRREYLDIPSLVSNKDYFQACYEINGVKHFWSYMKGSGAYPELDALGETTVSALGTYYPLIHFIHNQKLLDSIDTEEDYNLTKKLCGLLEIDSTQIFNELRGNPDIDQLNQATLMFAVPANSSNDLDQRYGFEFFKKIALAQSKGSPAVVGESLFKRKTHTPGRSLVIADKKFNMSLSYGGIILQRHVGKIEGKGKYHGKVTTGSASYDAKNPVTGMIETFYKFGNIHHYYHQVSEDLYDEIQVVNLRVAYKVFEEYYTTGESGSELLMLPLDKGIVDGMPVTVREQIVARSLRFVFNSYQIQYIQFYERGPFKVFMMVIAVVIAIYTPGTGGGLMSAISAGGAVALAAIWSTLIVPILQVALIAEGTKIFVKTFGQDFAILVAVIAVAYGAYSQFNGSALFADNLIRIGNGLLNAVQQTIQEQMGKLQEDFTEFESYTKDMYEQLEDTANELLSSNLLARLPEIRFGEAPSSFFNRTVHSGNIGTQSISAVSNYVPIALKLPSFNDTIQGFKNG